MDTAQRALAYLKGELDATESAAFEAELAESQEARTELERSRELLDLMTAANDASITRLANSILQSAIKERASHIHLTSETATLVRFRVDGHLRESMSLPRDLHAPLIDRLKELAACNLMERQIPQAGRISVRNGGQSYDVRANFLPTVQGEAAILEVMSREHVLLGLDRLGLTETQIATLHRLLARPFGLIVVTGYAASGKTTLLYSLLKHLLAENAQRQIFTVEDPVEYLLPGLTQIQVDRKQGLTFAAALSTFLHSDPDAMMISELRNQICAQRALELALSRCLVLTQLHVSGTVGVSRRLRDIGIGANFLTAQTLAGAIAVRLVRRVCPHCIEEYTPDPDALQKAGFSILEDGPFQHGKGCRRCAQTGYCGRIGLFEVLESTDALRRLIAENAPESVLWQETFGRNGGSLWDDAKAKIRAGVTTVEEAAWALFDVPQPRTASAFSLAPYSLDL